MVQSKLLLKYKDLQHYFFDKNDTSHWADLPVRFDDCITVEQVHGNKMTLLQNGEKQYFSGSDGLVTNQALFLAIRTADCLPILLYEPNRKIHAAVHAGWKGLFAGIVKNTIKTMKKLEANSQSIVVTIGPHIGKCCYNVSKERILCFQKKGYHINKAYQLKKGNWYLDLAELAISDLLLEGILKKNIDILPACTSCNKIFHSYRRDGANCGRIWSVIGRN